MASQASHWKMNIIKHLRENFCSLWQNWSVKLLLSLLLFWKVRETLNARLCKSAEQFSVSEGDVVGQWVFSCETNNGRAKIFMQKDVHTICVTIQPHRNWETTVFFRMRKMYGIVYLGWAVCHRVSSKIEPSRKDKSKIKNISTQLSWMHCVERQVPSTSHRESIAFLRMGKVMRRNTGRSDCPQSFISRACGSGGKLAAEAGPRGKSAVPPSLARRDRAGPVKPSSANSMVTTRQVHVVTRQVQSQAQHIYSIADVQYSSGKVKFSQVEGSWGRDNMMSLMYVSAGRWHWSGGVLRFIAEEWRGVSRVCMSGQEGVQQLVFGSHGYLWTWRCNFFKANWRSNFFKAKEFRRQSFVFPPSLSVDPYCLRLHFLSSCPV